MEGTESMKFEPKARLKFWKVELVGTKLGDQSIVTATTALEAKKKTLAELNRTGSNYENEWTLRTLKASRISRKEAKFQANEYFGKADNFKYLTGGKVLFDFNNYEPEKDDDYFYGQTYN